MSNINQITSTEEETTFTSAVELAISTNHISNGIGILHTSAADTIAQLKKIGL